MRVSILLPIYYNPDEEGNKREIEPEKMHQTKVELTNQFTGVTITQTISDGMWNDPKNNKRYEDTTKTIYADINPSLKSLKFLVKYKGVLEERFEQEEIFMNLLPVFKV
ncbi:MAG: hypothetical protein ABIH53_02380 [archaeon]